MAHPLLKDLDNLVENKIITEETAKQIAIYYSNRESDSSGRFTTVLAILGVLLLSSGIILVLAHNWDMLGRVTKTIIAFTPLVLGQGLCLFALSKRKNDLPGRSQTTSVREECASVFLFFAVATSISLIAQIYQVDGDMAGFLQTWALLTLPLVFIMRSSMVSLLLIAMTTWYAGIIGYSQNEIPYWYIGILLILAIHYSRFLKNPASNFFILHNWFISVSLLIVLGCFIKDGYGRYEWAFIGYMALGGIFYLLGNTTLMQTQRWYANPFRLIGTLTIIAILITWTFDWIWNAFNYGAAENSTIAFNHLFAYISTTLIIICGYLFIRTSRGNYFDLIALSPFIFMAGVIGFHNIAYLGILFFNIWVLAIGIYYIRKGAAWNHLGILNFGLLIIAMLAMFRFFDANIPFIWRGLIFMATGAGFFVSNLLIIRKRNATKTIKA